MEKLTVTNLKKISEISNGEVVELPAFVEDTPFVARLKKPSLLGLVSKGIIPNALLGVAQSLFNGKISQVNKDANAFKETAEIFHIIAENALVEPTVEELEKSGLFLTDLQYLAIFNYTQMGVKALAGFRG